MLRLFGMNLFCMLERDEFGGTRGKTVIDWIVSLKNMLKILTPSTSECDLIWQMKLITLKWGH